MKVFRTLLANSLFLATTLWAQTPSALLTAGLETLRNPGAPPSSCGPTSSGPECSHVAICSELSAHRNEPYLRNNGPGKRIMNAQWLQAAASVVECGRAKDLLQRGSGIPYDPEAFDTWLQTQSDDIVAPMSRARMLMARESFMKAQPAQAEGQSDQDYYRSLVNSALTAANVTNVAPLQEGIGLLADQLLATDRYEDESLDWSKVPAEIRTVLQDPTVNPLILASKGPEAAAALEQLRPKFQVAFDKIETVRTQVLRVIDEQIARYPQRRALLEEMKTRVGSVSPQFVVKPQEVSDSCSTPNAFYDPIEHTLKVCPQYLDMDASMIVTVAHELGHSIDPCSFAMPLYGTQGGEERSFSARDIVSEARATGATGLTDITSRGAPYGSNPFGEVLSCLASPDSLNAPTATLSEAQRLVAARDAQLSRRGEALPAGSITQAELPALYDQFRGCSSLPGRVQQGEAFADWISAEAMRHMPGPFSLAEVGADFLTGDCPNTMPSYAPQIVSALTANRCQPPEVTPDRYMPRIFGISAQLGQLAEGELDEHSSASDRIDRLYAVQPELRRIMGCEGAPQQGRYCAP